jgi:hypothetical protein
MVDESLLNRGTNPVPKQNGLVNNMNEVNWLAHLAKRGQATSSDEAKFSIFIVSLGTGCV